MKFLLPILGFFLNTLSLIWPSKAQQLGFNLFCMPFAKRVKPEQKKYLLGLKSDKKILNKTPIMTYQWGTGSNKVLCIHGWASHSYRWRGYAETLIQQDFSVYALDAPAHGLSEGKYLTLLDYAQVISEYIDIIGPIDAIIGHSLGGYATVYYLSHYPNIEKICPVIMAAPGEVSDFFEHYQRLLGLNSRTMQLMQEEFLSRIGRRPEEFSSPKIAKNLTNNALIVHDQGDKDTDYTYSVKLHEAWKDSKLILTKNLGHKLKSAELRQQILEHIYSNTLASK